MSRSNDEFLGRLPWLEMLRDHERRLARLERHTPGVDDEPGGAEGEGEAAARKGAPAVRNINARYVGGFQAAEEARPRHLLPLDKLGNADYRSTGGIIYGNRFIAGYGDAVAILDGVDASYRFWAGASAAGSAPYRILQSGNLEFGSGASVVTMRSSPSPGAIVDFSASGDMVISLTFGTSTNLGGLLWSEGNNRRWLLHYNSASSGQLDFYSYTTNGAILQLGRTGASSRVNTPWAVFDGAGGSPILDAAASGVQVGRCITLKVLTASPTSAVQGTLAYADGTSWNPGGSGAGFYEYNGTTWRKLTN